MTQATQVQYACANPATRNRVTTFFRALLIIPLAIVLFFFAIAAEVVAIVHWFIIVFTGKRNRGMWDFTMRFNAAWTRLTAYYQLQHDQYPAFGLDDAQSPVQYAIEFDEAANRVTTIFRIVVAIPAIVINYFLGIAGNACTIISWLVIIFTGKQPDGLHQFIGKVVHYGAQTQAYIGLLTDTYPSFS